MGIPHCRQCAEYADSDKASEFLNPIAGRFSASRRPTLPSQ